MLHDKPFRLEDIRARMNGIISLMPVMRDLAVYHKHTEAAEHYLRAISILQAAKQSISPLNTQTPQSLGKAVSDILLAVDIIKSHSLPIDWQPLYDLLPILRELRGDLERK